MLTLDLSLEFSITLIVISSGIVLYLIRKIRSNVKCECKNFNVKWMPGLGDANDYPLLKKCGSDCKR